MTDDDKEERARVYHKIAPLIRVFQAWMGVSPTGRDWHMEELRRFVLQYVPEIAPDSPGRILRQMRQEKSLNYENVDRAQSLYRFIPIVP